jgi:hypothetical protein
MDNISFAYILEWVAFSRLHLEWAAFFHVHLEWVSFIRLHLEWAAFIDYIWNGRHSLITSGMDGIHLIVVGMGYNII